MHDIHALTEAEWFRAVMDRNYLRVKASVNDFKGSRDIDGDTGLIKAVRGNDIEMVRILAPHENRGVNRDGRTALIIAAMHEYPEACSILAPYEKMVTLPDKRTALMQAAATGSVSCVRALVDHFFQEVDAQGWTALDYAVSRGHYDCVRILCETQKPTLENLDRCIALSETSKKDKIHAFLTNYKDHAYAAKDDTVGRVRSMRIEPEDAGMRASPSTAISSTYDSAHLPLQTTYNRYVEHEDPRGTATMSPGQKAFDPQPNIHYDILGPRHAAAEIASYNRTGSGTSPSESLDTYGILPRQSPLGGLEYTPQSRSYIDTRDLSPHLVNQKNDKSLINSVPPSGTFRYSPSTHTSSSSRPMSSRPFYSELGTSNLDTAAELRELRSSIERSNQHQKALESQLNVLQATLDSTIQRSLSASNHGNSPHKQNSSYPQDGILFNGPITPSTHSNYGPPVTVSQSLEPRGYQKSAYHATECTPDVATDYSGSLAAPTRPLNSYTRTSVIEDLPPASEPYKPTGQFQTMQDQPYNTAASGSYAPRSFTESQHSGNEYFDQDGNTILMIAAQSKDNALLRENLHLAKRVNKLGKTALMFAAEQNNLEAVNLLVTREAKARAFADNDYTALMYAAQRGYADCVRTLAQYESRLHSKMGYTALMLAAQNNHVECTMILKPYEAGMQTPSGLTALICAASNGNDECVKLLVDREATMSTTDLSQQGSGFTALMAAARTGSYGCTKILLPYEAHLVQETGKTAQDWANESWYSNSKTRDLIYEYGVSKATRM